MPPIPSLRTFLRPEISPNYLSNVKMRAADSMSAWQLHRLPAVAATCIWYRKRWRGAGFSPHPPSYSVTSLDKSRNDNSDRNKEGPPTNCVLSVHTHDVQPPRHRHVTPFMCSAAKRQSVVVLVSVKHLQRYFMKIMKTDGDC